MSNWTRAQWEAFGRHIITTLSATVATLVMVNMVKAEDAAQIVSSATQLIVTLTGLAATIVPIVAGIWASRTAAPESQAQQTVQNLKSGVPLNGKRIELIKAIADQPDVRKVVMRDPTAAMDIPSEKVTGA